MSAFGIFALILTTAYIIYFVVVISRDMISGRKDGDTSSGTETFDVSSFSQEESVEVKEIEGGFAIGESEVPTEIISVQPQKDEGGNADKKSTEEITKAMTAGMDDSEKDVEFDVSIDDLHFREELINGNGKSHFVRRVVNAAAEPQTTSADNAPVLDRI